MVKIRRSPGLHYDRRIDIAFICTGNICRSPIAEALLRARLANIAPEVTIGSAGLLFDGRPAERNAVSVLAKRGIDISGHAARRISEPLLEDSSVIVGMERRHVREVAALAPELFSRSFTLPELVALAREQGPRPADIDLRSWVIDLGWHRSVVDYSFSDPDSEVADPMGGSVRAFRTSADTIDRLLAGFVEHAWPDSPPRGHLVAPPTHGGIHADRDRG